MKISFLNSLDFSLFFRDFQGNSLLVKVEVILIGPTLHVLFYNSDDMPPPFRIDNYSLVRKVYWLFRSIIAHLLF